jgi:hypothetical protein
MSLPPPTLKRKWSDDDIPLAVLKKNKEHHMFPGLMSNIELAAISMASLKDGNSTVGTFWSISSQ